MRSPAILDYCFPVLAGFTGSGAGATRTYTLATPTEPNGNKPVTARNQALLNSSATNFTLTSDSTAPTGGALTVNGTGANGGGTNSYDGDGAFTIGLRTDYNADAGAGVNTSILTREQGTLNADACSAYGAPTTLVGTPAQSGLATGCYRYALTGTDNVGNTDHDHHRRQGRHHRPDRPQPGARRLERRRAHHRHDRLLPPRRQRLLRRHRLARPTASPASPPTPSPPSPASPSPAPAARAPTPSRPRPSPTAPRRSPQPTTPAAPTTPPSPSPPTRRLRPAVRSRQMAAAPTTPTAPSRSRRPTTPTAAPASPRRRSRAPPQRSSTTCAAASPAPIR